MAAVIQQSAGDARDARFDSILTPAALAFLTELTERFGGRVAQLLAAREQRQARIDAGGDQLDLAGGHGGALGLEVLHLGGGEVLHLHRALHPGGAAGGVLGLGNDADGAGFRGLEGDGGLAFPVALRVERLQERIDGVAAVAARDARNVALSGRCIAIPGVLTDLPLPAGALLRGGLSRGFACEYRKLGPLRPGRPAPPS